MALEAIAEKLWKARAEGDACPSWLPGSLDLDEALAVQLALLERERSEGRALGGWKIGLTSPRARKALGADARPFAYLRAEDVLASGATLEAGAIRKPSIEPELCFAFARPLGGASVSRDAVLAALGRVSAGFEINERRRGSATPDLPAMVTDRLTQRAIVVGAGVDPSEIPDLDAIACRLSRNGEVVYAGTSRDELDSHLESLRRLVVGLAAHGRALEPGQHVITGAFARFDAAAGERWRSSYAGVGDVEVAFR